MKRFFALISLASLLLVLNACALLKKGHGHDGQQEAGWIALFDGKSLNGWKASENPESFTVQDGAIVANGKRSHFYYDGPVMNHDFKNFELQVDAVTKPGSNGGIYFHTQFKEGIWPDKGYEVQVNTTHKDWRRTGSLYAVENVSETQTKDNVWFTEHIIVNGKRIIIKVDGKTVVDYTEPDAPERPDNMKGRVLSSGTIALQGHDPGSTVCYKNIRIKPLP